MFLLYNFFSAIAILIYLPWLLLKKGPENRFRYISERLGLSQYSNTDIWIHAVSVGEVIACIPFLKTLKEEFPHIKIVFSTTTYTGQKIARERFPDADRIMYIPWDTWLCINRAVRLIRPKIFITVETELWPQLFKKLKEAEAYIVILNGRISKESFKGYNRIKPLIKRVLSYTDFFYMQGSDDAYRVTTLGANPEKVAIMGNFKFDINLHKSQESSAWTDGIGGHILVAGSTHKGEEDIMLDAYENIKKTIPDLKLILAPRHPERFQEVEEVIKKRGLNFIRRSEISQGVRVMDQELEDIILLDTIGELSAVYSKATVVFVGGSLFPYGGHNILEPAYWAKPIIFGPYMDNFPIAKEFLKQAAALMVENTLDIVNAVNELLKNTEKANQLGQRAKVIVQGNIGAVEKALGLIRGLLSETRYRGAT
ncbi:MAG: 3-deoxy-D-manno-octulosonic acid transferase [Nitrospirae bacterium]|nr:3-deoxy-D-manno-octulosonic acid transferase [Nitrospirota bacterium]